MVQRKIPAVLRRGVTVILGATTLVITLLGCNGAVSIEETKAIEEDVESTDDPFASFADSDRPGPEYVPAPAGWVHRDCVYEVPDGAMITRGEDGTTLVHDKEGREFARIAPCKDPPALRLGPAGEFGEIVDKAVNGWVEFTFLTSPGGNPWGWDWFKRADVEMLVPSNPPSNGALIYLFSGFQPSFAVADILQTVVQYGQSPAGGGNYWSMAAWYVEQSGNAMFSSLKTLSAGNEIKGTLNGTNCNSAGDCAWFLTMQRTSGGSSQTTVLAVRPDEYPMELVVPTVLEVYGVNSCSQLPGTNAWFYDAYIYQPGATLSSLFEVTSPWSTAAPASTSPNCAWGVSTVNRGATLEY